jgi:hypothetical protein
MKERCHAFLLPLVNSWAQEGVSAFHSDLSTSSQCVKEPQGSLASRIRLINSPELTALKKCIGIKGTGHLLPFLSRTLGICCSCTWPLLVPTSLSTPEKPQRRHAEHSELRVSCIWVMICHLFISLSSEWKLFPNYSRFCLFWFTGGGFPTSV